MILSRVAEADGGVAQAVVLPIADLRAHLNLTHQADDALILALAEAARAHLEGADGTGGVLGRAITRHRLLARLPALGAAAIPLRQPPVREVVAVTYRDAAGLSQTLAAASWRLVPHSVMPFIERVDGTTWPDTATRWDAVTVEYDVGPDDLAADIKHAILMHVAHLYANREAAGESMAPLPLAYNALIAPHRTHGWI